MRHRLRRALGRLVDTLPKRLLWLMWATLVLSHLLAFSLVRGWSGPPPGPPSGRPPVVQPGGPGGPPPDAPGPRRGGPPGAPPGDSPGAPPPAMPTPVFPSLPPTPGLGDGPGLPWPSLLLDYGVRLLFIALAAWAGGRWLSGPLRRLGAASRELGRALRSGRPAPQLDDRAGTREVQQLAQEFNGMALQLQRAFEGRALMVAAISHDLRTPLTRLRMRLETQLEPGAPAARLERLREQSVADLREMNALIDSVLTVFQPQGSHEPSQPIDLRALLQAVVDDATDAAEPGQFLHLDAPAGDWRLQAPPHALRRVLDNLVGNALRYGGGRVRVALRPGPEVQIDDDGPGIPPALLDAVFEPFVRVDASRHRASGGVGLGLYIARQLSEAMGAQLRLSNRPEGGLRASLTWGDSVRRTTKA